MNDPPTLVARLTPAGTGAVATIGIRGPRAWSLTQSMFTPHGRPLAADPRVGHFRVGRFGGELADEVIVCVRQTEPSPRVDLHCHGGVQVVEHLLGQLIAQGCERSSAEAFQAGEVDALTVAATLALTQAPTAHIASILLDQMQGALTQALTALEAALLRDDTAAVEQQLQQLTAQVELGRHLLHPWRIAIAGPPNVGKSSLLNALAGYQRSIVAPLPGTTRDVVSTQVAFEGLVFELIDTAGLRETREAIEAAGIQRAREVLGSADVCLWLIDTTGDPVGPETDSLLSATVAPERLFRVLSKGDLPAAWPRSRFTDGLVLSARTGEGVATLMARLVATCLPHPPAPGAAVPFTPGLAAQIEQLAMVWRTGSRSEAVQNLQHLRAHPG